VACNFKSHVIDISHQCDQKVTRGEKELKIANRSWVRVRVRVRFRVKVAPFSSFQLRFALFRFLVTLLETNA